MPSWFLCKIRYRKPDEAGKLQTITESYLVDAVSFTEAEARLLSRLMDTHKEYDLASAGPARVADVFGFPDGNDEGVFWHKCKVSYVSLDEKSGKEKKIHNIMLVQAATVKQAHERIEESLAGMTIPFTVQAVEQTKILEIFHYSEKS